MAHFIDTHSAANGTFPADLTADALEQFLVGFRSACAEEGVTLLQVFANLEQGRAYCLTSAPDAEAVRRAHSRVGLPFDGIDEVLAAGPIAVAEALS